MGKKKGSSSKNPKKYYISAEEQIICMSPVDSILSIKINDAIAHSEPISNSNTSIYIDKPNLFGGDDSEGGVKGNVEIRFGRQNQEKSQTLIQKIGDVVLSATRGVVSIVMKDFYLGNNPYDKAWSFKVRSTLLDNNYQPNWYQEKASISHTRGDSSFRQLNYWQRKNHYYHVTNSAKRPNNLVGFIMMKPNSYEPIPIKSQFEIKYFNQDLTTGGKHDVIKNESSIRFSIGTGHYGTPNYRYEYAENYVLQLSKYLSNNTVYLDKNASIRQSSFMFTSGSGATSDRNEQPHPSFDTGFSSYDDFTGAYIYADVDNNKIYISLPYSSTSGSSGYNPQTGTYGNVVTTTEQTKTVDSTDRMVCAVEERAYTMNDDYNVTEYYVDKEVKSKKISFKSFEIKDSIEIFHQTLALKGIPLAIYINHKDNFACILEVIGTNYYVAYGNASGDVLGSIDVSSQFEQADDGITTDNTYFCYTENNLYLIAKDHIVCFNRVGYAESFNGQVDYNPAHAIREAITNTIWGLGKDPRYLDDANFKAVADTLYQEQLGISFVFDDGDKVSDFIQKVLDIIGGVIRFNRFTGLIELKLLRNDYDRDNIPHFNYDNIVEISDVERTALNDCINQVTLKYTDHESGGEASIVVQDLGLLAQTNEVNNSDIDFQYICWRDTAYNLAIRELCGVSSQFMSCEITILDTNTQLNLGDVIKLTFPKLNIFNVIFRINKISYGSSKDRRITLSLSQDKYDYITSGSYIPEKDDSDLGNTTTTSKDRLQFYATQECPFYILYKELGSSVITEKLVDNTEYAKILPLVSKANANAIISASGFLSYDMGKTYTQSRSDIEFRSSCVLKTSLGYLDSEFEYNNDMGMAKVTSGMLGFIDDEIVCVGYVNQNSNKMTIGRGCLDTQVEQHSVGSVVYFVPLNNIALLDEEFVEEDNVFVKYVATTNNGMGNIANAGLNVVNLEMRALRPYPVANVKFNGEYFPKELKDKDYRTYPLNISFCLRNRLNQITDEIYTWVSDNIAPEENTKVYLRWYNDNRDLIKTEELTQISNDVLIPSEIESNTVTVVITTSKDGLECYQPFEHTFEIMSSPSYIEVYYNEEDGALYQKYDEKLEVDFKLENGVLNYDIDQNLADRISFELVDDRILNKKTEG